MNTDDMQDPGEGGARIEDLPASDNQMLAEERERPSVLRAPPGDPDEDADGSPSPGGPPDSE